MVLLKTVLTVYDYTDDIWNRGLLGGSVLCELIDNIFQGLSRTINYSVSIASEY